MKEQDKSDYKELQVPNIVCEIPQSILDKFPPEYSEIIKNQNIQTQYIKWICSALVDTNTQVRKTNGRVIDLEFITEDVIEDHESLKKLKEYHIKIMNWKTLLGILFGFFLTLIGVVATTIRIVNSFN